MDTLHLVTTLALGFGAIVMLVAIVNIIKLIRILKESKFRNSWIILGIEVGLFFAGYIVFLFLLLNTKLTHIEVFSSAIFLLGAMFVYMVVSNGQLTINDLLSTSVSKTYLENVIKSMADTLIVVNTDESSTIRTVNNAALNLLKYTEKEIVGISIEQVFDEKLVEKLNINLLQKGEHISKFETNYITKDGEKIPVLFSASPLQNRLGKTEGIIFVAQDITERKKAEEKIKSYLKKLEESEAQLRELNASKDKFFSIIAHDLRSPFTVLLGYSEIIAQDIEELSNQEIIEFAENLHKQSKIVFDLLENHVNMVTNSNRKNRFRTREIRYEQRCKGSKAAIR